MVRLDFHYQLYSAAALDRTVELYREHAATEREQGPAHYRVEIEAGDAEIERQLAGEIGNYALALTVEERRSGGLGG